MVRRLYLHIGQYKTGSTALQKFLAQNAEALASKGFIYPISFTRDNAHFPINRRLRKSYSDPKVSIEFRELFEEIDSSKMQNVVLSCEGFSSETIPYYNKAQTIYLWKKIIDLFPGYDIKVIMYVRRQDESIESRMIQQIKSKSAATLAVLEDYLSKETSLDYFNVAKSLEKSLVLML